MIDPLADLRALCQTPVDAVHRACILEATAPKAGNVYPGQPFVDLNYDHFVVAAKIAQKCLGGDAPFSRRILRAVKETQAQTGTNVNLGILLLLGPLVAADQSKTPGEAWPAAIARVIDRIGPAESREIFQAIGASSAGALGSVDQMDIHDNHAHEDIVAAMKLAAGYDRIALQYADGFTDLLQNILPIVYDSLCEFGEILRGIAVAHIRLLAASPDSLIARKQGLAAAERVQAKAAAVDVRDVNSCRQFDESLRSEGHELNPGTTADLIAAALYVLIQTHPSQL